MVVWAGWALRVIKGSVFALRSSDSVRGFWIPAQVGAQPAIVTSRSEIPAAGERS